MCMCVWKIFLQAAGVCNGMCGFDCMHNRRLISDGNSQTSVLDIVFLRMGSSHHPVQQVSFNVANGLFDLLLIRKNICK